MDGLRFLFALCIIIPHVMGVIGLVMLFLLLFRPKIFIWTIIWVVVLYNGIMWLGAKDDDADTVAAQPAPIVTPAPAIAPPPLPPVIKQPELPALPAPPALPARPYRQQ